MVKKDDHGIPIAYYNRQRGLTAREKAIRKKRKKNRRDKKKPKRFRIRVLPDTNIWSQRIKRQETETKVIERTDYFETLIYSGYVDEELSHVKSDDINKAKFESFRKKMRSRIKRAQGPVEKYSSMIKGKDKYILRDAEELGADIIVSNDSDFDSINGVISPKVMKPNPYLAHLRKRNKYRKNK